MSKQTGPACGNNPNHKLTAGDRQAVVEFRAYLTRRAALLEAAGTADELSLEIEQAMKAREVGPLTALQDLADKLRRMAYEAALSPYYEHPECGFHWHGRDGMDVPMRDGQPVCPRCELRRMADEPAATAIRATALREAADFVGNDDDCDCGGCDTCVPRALAAELRRMAGETPAAAETTADKADALGLSDAEYRAQSHAAAVSAVRAAIPGMYAHVGFRLEDVLNGVDETPAAETERCAHCGQPISRVTGTLAAWWVHNPGGNTVCDWARAATSPRATPRASVETQPSAVTHAIPLPGSHGISACCGRPPCEFVGEHVTRDPDKVTCTGPAAGARQDGADRPGLRERYRAAWAALTPEQQATRLAEFDQDDEPQDGAQPS